MTSGWKDFGSKLLVTDTNTHDHTVNKLQELHSWKNDRMPLKRAALKQNDKVNTCEVDGKPNHLDRWSKEALATHAAASLWACVQTLHLAVFLLDTLWRNSDHIEKLSLWMVFLHSTHRQWLRILEVPSFIQTLQHWRLWSPVVVVVCVAAHAENSSVGLRLRHFEPVQNPSRRMQVLHLRFSFFHDLSS